MTLYHKLMFNYHRKRATSCPRNKHFYKMQKHRLKMVMCEINDGA